MPYNLAWNCTSTPQRRIVLVSVSRTKSATVGWTDEKELLTLPTEEELTWFYVVMICVITGEWSGNRRALDTRFSVLQYACLIRTQLCWSSRVWISSQCWRSRRRSGGYVDNHHDRCRSPGR